MRPSLLQFDRNCLEALQAVNGYAPANARYAIDAVIEASNDLVEAQRVESEAAAAAASARQEAAAKEWEFHRLILGAKDQVVAQFGRDSNEAQSVGLKKKSEYKTRARKATSKGNA